MLMGFSAAAQMMPDSTVQIVSYWQVGDKYAYTCERSSKEVDAQGDTTSRKYSMETMEFEVVGMTDETYQLKLSYKDSEYSDFRCHRPPFLLPWSTSSARRDLQHGRAVEFHHTRHGTNDSRNQIMGRKGSDRLFQYRLPHIYCCNNWRRDHEVSNQRSGKHDI